MDTLRFINTLKYLYSPSPSEYVLYFQAFFRADHIRNCVSMSGEYRPPLLLIALDSVSHLLILVNASANFIIYCILSTHFQVIFQLYYFLLSWVFLMKEI